VPENKPPLSFHSCLVGFYRHSKSPHSSSLLFSHLISSYVNIFCHSHRNNDHNYPYHINGVQLEQLDSIQDLGVNFDSQLKFHKYIDDKINKAYSFLGIIKRNFTYLDKID